jgi:hypothetical protein
MSESDQQPVDQQPQEDGLTSFFSNILEPGSSLNPTFLLIVDFSFAFLLAILITLAFFTNGSVHFFFLIAVELALWASVKWFVMTSSKMDQN